MHSRILVIAFALTHFFALPCRSQETLSPDETRLAEAMKSYAAFAASLVDAEIESYRGKPADRQRLNMLKGLSESRRKNPYQIPVLLPWRLKPGDIGHLRGGLSGPNDDVENSFMVVQVIDSSNMLIRSHGKGHVADEAIVATPRRETLLWITGVDTSDLVDDSYIRLSQIMEVKGTRQYETASGTNTVFVLSTFPVQDIEPIVGKLRGIAKRDATEPTKKQEDAIRKWTDSTGTHSINAVFVKFLAGRVVLRKEDGSTIEIPVEKLSGEDRKWIEARAKLPKP